jgi:hypothetical protein
VLPRRAADRHAALLAVSQPVLGLLDLNRVAGALRCRLVAAAVPSAGVTHTDVDFEREMRLLLEERAILRALHEYAHAMDSGDEQRWVDSFTADAVFDVVEVVGDRRVHREHGHGDLAAYVAAYPKPPHFRKHVVVDPVIEVDLEHSCAHVESYWLLLQRDDEGGRPLVVAFGHYHDTMVKQGGRWLIEERLADVQATAAGPGATSRS